MADVKTMEQLVHESMAGDRFTTVLFGSFAAVALALAAVGIFGVMSFVVAQRTHDIGLRMALGAGRGRVLAEILREGMVTAIVGVVVGTAGAYAVGRAMQGLVYGVGTFDPDGLLCRGRYAAGVRAPGLPGARAPRRLGRSHDRIATGVTLSASYPLSARRPPFVVDR